MRNSVTTRRRNITRLIAVVASMVISIGMAYGYYYLNHFTANTDGWILNYPYGRAGVSLNPTDTTMNLNTGGNGTLQIRNNVNAGDSSYLGFWVGRMAFYSNQSFTASPTNPFGVEFRRTYSRVDPHAEIYLNDNPESHRHMAAQSYWLVQETTPLDTGVEFSTFPNYVLMYDMMRMTYNTGSGQPRSTWGYYISSEQRFDLTSTTRPDGTSYDITDNATYTLEWNYDDHYGDGTRENIGDGDFGNGTYNAIRNNTNAVVIRMTHDGSNVRFYINPDPDDSNPYPNEFLLVGSAPISWSDNIKVMMGHEAKRADCEKQEADYDYVLVRSVASSLVSEIYPYQIKKGSTNTYQIVITPTFTANDAGIGELVITKPAAYDAFAWNVGDVQVFSDNGTGTNHGTISTIQKMTYTGTVPTADNEVYITVDGANLKLRFRQTSDANNGVINSSTSDKRIVVVFPMRSPDTANATGDSFQIHADCVKYDGQDYSRWSTTGRMQSVAGDAYGSLFAGNTLSVQRFIDPDSLATVSPELIYIGANRTVYLYVATTNQNSPPISELRIQVPPGYEVNTADPTRFSSLYISSNDSHVFATNVSGTNFIYVRYEADGSPLPSPGGLDRITIELDSTPTNFSGPQTNTVWNATVYSSVAGTSGTQCRTNGTYPNRNVIVRQLPPDVTGAVTTTIVEGGTNYIHNHVKNNYITYTVVNNGGTGNTIKLIRIQLPENITNVDSMSSALIPDGMELANLTYNPGLRQITANYMGASTVIPSGGSDTITFWMADNITPMSGSTNYLMTMVANNSNGDGEVAASEGPGGWSIYWKNPPASGNAAVETVNSITSGGTNKIHTTDVSTQIKVSINNTGGTFNTIRLVEVVLPTCFTNIHSLSSLVIQDDVSNIIQQSNRIYIRYHNDGSGYLDNLATDTLTLTAVDNVGLTTVSSVTLQVRVANTSNSNDLQNTGNLGMGNKKIAFEIPPVTAQGYVIPVMVDSSTVTNQLTYTLSNTAAYDNYLGEVRIMIPDSVASNLIDAQSAVLSGPHPANVSINITGTTNYIRLLYHGASPLYGGMQDTVTFKMIDHIDDQTNLVVVARASNVRNEWTDLDVTPGQTNLITIQIPPASASAYVSPNMIFASPDTMVTNLVIVKITNTGTGGNNITNAVITFPDFMAFNMNSISNTLDTAYDLQNGARTLTLFYTNNKLLAGASDTVYIYFRNNLSTLQNDYSFSCTVDNGQGPQAASTVSGRSLLVHVIQQPTVQIAQADATPNEIYTTDTLSQFTYTLINGQTGGKAVKKMLIRIPYPFVGEDISINSPWPGSSENLLTNGHEEIEVDYSVNDLDAGAQDAVQFTVKDVFILGTTNVDWQAWVDYGDGAGYRETKTASGKSVNISFVFPDAVASAIVSPRSINMNDTASELTVTITNTGVPGNHIKMAEIDLGSVFTNITGATSSNLGGSITVVSNRILRLNYEANGTNIQSSGRDIIHCTAYDQITQISNTTISVRIANSTNAIHYRAAGEMSTDSLKIEFYRPDYIANAYIVPVQPISGEKPHSIYSTITTSTLEFRVINNGAPGNNLEVVKLYIPGQVFDSASIADISSQQTGSVSEVVGNTLTVYYTNTPLQTTESDTVRFRINDLVTYSNASSLWISASRFSTSGSDFLTNAVATGQSNVVHLEMPQPVGKARLLEREIFTSTPAFTTVLDVSNTGSGSNNLSKVRITVPTGLRNGLDTGSLTNSFAAAIGYTNGVFTLNYTNFTPGKNDRLYLSCNNSYSTNTELSVTVQLDNNTEQAAAQEWNANALQLRIVTPPSGYVEIPNPKDSVYNRLYSTDYENQYKVYLNNDGTGSKSMTKARVMLPQQFVFTCESSRVSTNNITITSNIVEIDYQTNVIAPGENDVLTLVVVAPFHSGDTNISLQFETGNINETGLNQGFSQGRLYSGKSWQVSYVHPDVDSQYHITGFAGGVKPSILVAPKGSIAATNFKILVSNQGVQSNMIHSVRINVPEVFTQISAITSTISGASLQTNGSTITVNYAATKLYAGSNDTIEFTVNYAVNDSTNNLAFTVQADNNNGKGYAAGSVTSGQFNTVDIKYPPISVFAGIKNLESIYTINTNASVTYLVKNRAQGFTIFRSVITNFDMSLFDSIQVSSSKATNSVIDKPNGTISLNYDGENGIAFDTYDTVTINVTYRITNNVVSTLTLKNICFLTNAVLLSSTNVEARVLEPIDTDTGKVDNQNLTIGPAPYARISGTILPYIKVDAGSQGNFLPNIVKVEVVGLTNTTVLSTPYAKDTAADGSLVNRTLQTYSEPSLQGTYSLGYVPAGTHRIRFSSEGFRITLTNFTFLSNQNQVVPTISLKNALFDSDGSGSQMVIDYNDTNTRFILPAGSLLDQFSLDISVVDMDEPQENDVQENENVKNVNNTDSLGCFHFSIRNQQDDSPTGTGLGGDATLILHYTTSNLNLPLGSEWDEQNLAIYYWKPTTKEWVAVGGLVDTDNDLIKAKVNYLHHYYAVLSVDPANITGAVYNVKASPNPFAPGRGEEATAKVKLTFSFKDPQPTYEVKIYNMRGQLIRSFERNGEYRQGEVFWDGKDSNGFRLAGGVYVYQIKAGDQVFTGTVLMLR